MTFNSSFAFAGDGEKTLALGGYCKLASEQQFAMITTARVSGSPSCQPVTQKYDRVPTGNIVPTLLTWRVAFNDQSEASDWVT